MASRAAANVVWLLARRDFRERYLGSVLGWLWGVIHPLVLLAVYTFLFRSALGAELPRDETTESYPLFLLAGLLPWLYFADGLTRATNSLAQYASVITTSPFPSQAVPASVLLSTGAVHALSVAALVVAAAAGGHAPRTSLFLLPFWFALLGLFSLGVSWVTAALQVYLKDTAQFLSVGLIVWFWATPVFLPEAYYPDAIGAALAWNPVRYAVLGYRWAILGGAAPGAAETGILTAFALSSATAGALFFRRARRGFADVL